MTSPKTIHPSSRNPLPMGLTAKSANGAPVSSVLMPTAADRGVVALIVRLVEVMLVWQERRRQRRQLSRMDDYMLRDIGLSSADVEHEVHKPFWRL